MTAELHSALIPVRLWMRPSPPPARTTLLGEFRQMIREAVRCEVRGLQDRQSFVAASPWLTQGEAQAYLKMSRTTLYERRTARRLAKTSEAQAAAFAPEYGSGTALRFNKNELDEWMSRQQRGH